jgi:hypothetical protein
MSIHMQKYTSHIITQEHLQYPCLKINKNTVQWSVCIYITSKDFHHLKCLKVQFGHHDYYF